MFFLIAQAVATSGVDVEQLVLQGGALSAVLFAFWMMLKWMLTSFTRSQEDDKKQMIVLTMAIMAFSKQLLTHDLTVSGLNPDAGADFQDRDSRAHAKYESCMTELEKINGYLEKLLDSKVPA